MFFCTSQIQSRYFERRGEIIRTSGGEPATDFGVQMSKVAEGVLSPRYVNPLPEGSTIKEGQGEGTPSEVVLEKYVIAPRMFKQVVANGHSEFSSGRQQDASEYFMHLLQVRVRLG